MPVAQYTPEQLLKIDQSVALQEQQKIQRGNTPLDNDWVRVNKKVILYRRLHQSKMIKFEHGVSKKPGRVGWHTVMMTRTNQKSQDIIDEDLSNKVKVRGESGSYFDWMMGGFVKNDGTLIPQTDLDSNYDRILLAPAPSSDRVENDPIVSIEVTAHDKTQDKDGVITVSIFGAKKTKELPIGSSRQDVMDACFELSGSAKKGSFVFLSGRDLFNDINNKKTFALQGVESKKFHNSRAVLAGDSGEVDRQTAYINAKDNAQEAGPQICEAFFTTHCMDNDGRPVYDDKNRRVALSKVPFLDLRVGARDHSDYCVSRQEGGRTISEFQSTSHLEKYLSVCATNFYFQCRAAHELGATPLLMGPRIFLGSLSDNTRTMIQEIFPRLMLEAIERCEREGMHFQRVYVCRDQNDLFLTQALFNMHANDYNIGDTKVIATTLFSHELQGARFSGGATDYTASNVMPNSCGMGGCSAQPTSAGFAKEESHDRLSCGLMSATAGIDNFPTNIDELPAAVTEVAHFDSRERLPKWQGKPVYISHSTYNKKYVTFTPSNDPVYTAALASAKQNAKQAFANGQMPFTPISASKAQQTANRVETNAEPTGNAQSSDNKDQKKTKEIELKGYDFVGTYPIFMSVYVVLVICLSILTVGLFPLIAYLVIKYTKHDNVKQSDIQDQNNNVSLEQNTPVIDIKQDATQEKDTKHKLSSTTQETKAESINPTNDVRDMEHTATQDIDIKHAEKQEKGTKQELSSTTQETQAESINPTNDVSRMQ